MPPKDNFKRWQAEDIAAMIIDTGVTDVTECQMQRWRDDDLYEWIEEWGFLWCSGSWHGTLEIEVPEA